jgi:hypothetical protein
MEARLRGDAEAMEARLRGDAEAMEARLTEKLEHNSTELEARLVGKLDRAAEAFATDVGHIHTEIRAVLDRVRKMDTNVATCIELLVRQSRWHGETDTKAIELLMRVNEIENRVHNLENRQLPPAA